VNLVTGGLIEIADYNDMALEVNRLFSDNTTSLAWSTSNLVLNDTAAGAGEAGGATRPLSPQPVATDHLVVTVDGVTLAATTGYTVAYTDPVTITFNDPLAASAVLQVFNRQTHRYGWGQTASVHPITAGDPILADEETLLAYLEANVNNLIDKVNVMETRIGGPSALTRVAPAAIIYATDKTTITTTIATDVTTGDEYWKNAVATISGAEETFVRTSDWNNQLVGEMRHTWADYDSFRYFFNTGCDLRAAITMTGATDNQGYANWVQVCNGMGTLILNYNSIDITNDGDADIAANLGAYDLTATYQTIYTSGSPTTPVDDAGDFDSYGIYSNLNIVFEARIVEDTPSAGNVSLEMRCTMNDQDVNTTTSGTTTYSGGHTLADDVTNNSAVFSITDHAPTLTTTNSFESTTTMAITGITQANPGVVTVASTTALTDGSEVDIASVVGMTQVNDLSFTITVINGTTFSIGADTSAYTAYSSAGTLTYQTDDT
jgi:hypothetical protein